MQVERYQLFYLNLLLFFLFVSNQFLLFFLILFIAVPYILNKLWVFYYIFFNNFERYDDGLLYLFDPDFEIMDYYTQMHIETYVLSNCHFDFDLFGGSIVLDSIDFIDFTIYKSLEERNKKYIYDNMLVYDTFSTLDLDDTSIQYTLDKLDNVSYITYNKKKNRNNININKLNIKKNQQLKNLIEVKNRVLTLCYIKNKKIKN